MKGRRGLLAANTTALLMSCASLLAPQALAADMVFKAYEPPPVGVPWWFHGYLELGARGFLNNPERDGVASQGGRSLAKYYEYSSNKPGPFLEGWVSAGSKDGLYQVDAWAENVGYDDQRYQLEASEAGRHYVAVGFDQLPHVYSTSARTLYNGVGSTRLTLPPGLSNQLFTDAGCTPGPAGCGHPIAAANAAQVQQDIQNNSRHTDIGIRRDTASVDYRYTPDDRWDFRANYSQTRRTGTQVDGVLFSPSTIGVAAEVPKPVADTTRNFGASGEYSGTSFWNKRFNIRMAYSGSIYTNDASSYTVENPFCPTGAVDVTCASAVSPSAPTALMSSWPNNRANGMSATLGADLPFQSRYMGTIAYTNMQQNQAFQPFTVTPFSTTGGVPPGWVGTPGIPANLTAALPAQSLNGGINTLLINNVLTTQITSDLRFKANYRFYNYDNNTPEIRFADWVQQDAAAAGFYPPVQAISVSYTKQNFGTELTWRPSREWNVGAAYGFERYEWERADTSATNENSGKFFVDWKPVRWLTARGSVLAAERRHETYDYLGFVGNAQWPSDPFNLTRYSTAYRQFMFDDRDRVKAQASLAIDVVRNVTVTPTVSIKNDDYRLAPSTEVGLNFDKAVSAGVEMVWVIGPETRLLLSYMNTHQKQLITSAGQSVPPFPPNQFASSNVVDRINTYIAAVTHTFIPNTLDMTVTYTYATANNSQPLVFADGSVPGSSTGGQFPDVHTSYHRFETVAKYTFDEIWVRQMGWRGKVAARLRYVWERNSVLNWQTDVMQTYMFSAIPNNFAGYMAWMAWNNPNYNVHLLGGSLAFTW